jgi:hypothetical protein
LSGTFVQEEDKNKKGVRFYGTGDRVPKTDDRDNLYNLPGPEEPTPGMSGGELLHGFLADLYRAPNPEVKNYIILLCSKWNVHYREQKG